MIEEFFVSLLCGGVLGAQLFRVVFVRSKDDDLPLVTKLVGVVAGGFLGFTAGKLVLLGFPAISGFPQNYFLLSIFVMVFGAGFQKFIRDHLGEHI